MTKLKKIRSSVKYSNVLRLCVGGVVAVAVEGAREPRGDGDALPRLLVDVRLVLRRHLEQVPVARQLQRVRRRGAGHLQTSPDICITYNICMEHTSSASNDS